MSDVGQSVDVTLTCRDRARELIDPTSITAMLEDPLGVETSYVYGSSPRFVRLSSGIYRLTFTPMMEGDWWVRGEYDHTSGGVTVSAAIERLCVSVFSTKFVRPT